MVRLTLFPESITFCKRKYQLSLSSCVDGGRRDFLLSRTQRKLACLAGHPPDGFGKVVQNKGQKIKEKEARFVGLGSPFATSDSDSDCALGCLCLSFSP